jgi:signal peptidase I
MTPEPPTRAPASSFPRRLAAVGLLGALGTVLAARAARRRARGPWRVVVEEASMLPGIAPGDWLLVDPTIRAWPPVGSVVVFRDPTDDGLSVKRVAALPGTSVPYAGGFLALGPDEGWLVADATPAATDAAGFGPPIDSTRFGPVALEALVGRVLFRYGPRGRLGLIPPAPAARA